MRVLSPAGSPNVPLMGTSIADEAWHNLRVWGIYFSIVLSHLRGFYGSPDMEELLLSGNFFTNMLDPTWEHVNASITIINKRVECAEHCTWASDLILSLKI